MDRITSGPDNRKMNLTDYHSKYFAHELTKRCAPDSVEKLAGAVASAQVDLEHPLQALRPGHGGTALARGWHLGCTGTTALVAPAPLGRGDLGAVFTVRGKHAVVAREVDARWGDERRQTGDEIQRAGAEIGGKPVGSAVGNRRYSPPT